MAVSNINLIWSLVSQLHETQAVACGNSNDKDGGRTEDIISPILLLYISEIHCIANY